MEMSDRERELRLRARDDFPWYAERCLRIAPKTGGLVPFVLNRAQRFVHDRAQAQLASLGRVRAQVLKARQQGLSTYIGGRIYWRVTHRRGVRAFILTHEQQATDTLFANVERFHEHNNPLLKPLTGAANAKELLFRGLDSGYRVGTAGTKEVGRSQTIQYFHGSEVALWPHAEDHATGVMQAIPSVGETEVWLESTAKGMTGYFAEQWRAAVAGSSEFEPIFVPWFWSEEYESEPGAGFEVRSDEADLVALHGLTPRQLTWRRAKVASLGSVELFQQEYPALPEEAFRASVGNAIMPVGLVRSAINRNVTPLPARRVWGLDVAASEAGDRSALAKRWGNTLEEPIKAWHEPDPMRTVGLVVREYQHAADKPDTICVDSIGLGVGVAARLRELGLPVMAVNVGEAPSVRESYARLKDELWFNARDWFAKKDCRIPDDSALIQELTSVEYNTLSSGRVEVEKKASLRKRLGLSPDLADAFVLTFAAPDFTAVNRGVYYETVDAWDA